MFARLTGEIRGQFCVNEHALMSIPDKSSKAATVRSLPRGDFSLKQRGQTSKG